MDGPFAFRIERSLCYAFFHLRRATPTSPTIEPMPSSTSEDGSGTAFSVIASDSEEPLWLMLMRRSAGVAVEPWQAQARYKGTVHEEIQEVSGLRPRLTPLVVE